MRLMRRIIISWIFLSALGCIILCMILTSCEDSIESPSPLSELNKIDYTLFPIYYEQDDCMVYTNLDGEIQINDQLQQAHFFYHDYAIVSQESYSSGPSSDKYYIEKSGQKLNDKTYYSASNYYNGYAVVRATWEDNYIYIDKRGEQVIPGSYALAGIVNNDLAPVSNTLYIYSDPGSIGKFNNRYYYINTEGERAFGNDEYAEAKSFYNGHAVAAIADSIDDTFFERKYGLINAKGETLIDFIYENAQEFCTEDLLAVKQDGQWGFVNTEGKVIVDFEYDYAYLYLEGFAAVKEGYNEWRFIDKNGKKSDFPYVFEHINYGFSEGLAAVKYDGKWGYIDTSGEFIIEPQYNTAPGFFINGYAYCENGIISNKGVLLFGATSPIYEKNASINENSTPKQADIQQLLFK